VTHFGAAIIMGTTKHFNFCVQIDTDEYWCIRDRLPEEDAFRVT